MPLSCRWLHLPGTYIDLILQTLPSSYPKPTLTSHLLFRTVTSCPLPIESEPYSHLILTPILLWPNPNPDATLPNPASYLTLSLPPYCYHSLPQGHNREQQQSSTTTNTPCPWESQIRHLSRSFTFLHIVVIVVIVITGIVDIIITIIFRNINNNNSCEANHPFTEVPYMIELTNVLILLIMLYWLCSYYYIVLDKI